MTPIRVLHRRTWATRRRTIIRLRIDPVKLGDFDSVRPENMEHVFALTMLTEAGTYIKEFVHGDFGRTEPNLSSLLGNCETDLMELDVMEVDLDWPPTIDEKLVKDRLTSSSINQADKMDNSDAALADLYEKGYKYMQEAQNTPRGDKRQDSLLQSRRLFERSMQIVESLALFSDNETLEDIATANLKYLLIPAYLASISLSGEIGSRRLEAFTKAESYTRQFLDRISLYGLGCHRLEQVLKSIDNPSQLSTQQPISSTAILEEQVRNRAEKIDRLNKTRQLEDKLADLERRLNSGETVDDEVSRDYYISLVHKWITETLENYERIVQPGLAFERGRASGLDNHDLPLANTEPPSSGSEGKTFTIVKDQLQKKAFGVGYPSLPTVSVDEFITTKINDGSLAFKSQKEIYANSLQRYAEQPNLRRDQEEQSDEEREMKEERDDTEELVKKRAWDEFKDETPRGSGNRYNMG